MRDQRISSDASGRMIIRILTICSLVSALASAANAQYWATKCGGTGLEHVSDVKSDVADAVYSIGDYSAGATIAGQPLISQGLSDLFVLKQDAAGTIVWLKRAGGAGIDLGANVCPAPDGSVLVCGEFSGTADLFGTTFNANGGSTDLFVAKLDGSDGHALWIRTGGSASFSDHAGGIAVAGDGRVLVTGEFRGTGVFDAGTFNSTIDPGTALPGFDVFVMSYTAGGTAEWFKQGLAKYDDQASDVAVDAQGNAYACGQYSDTITFDGQHANIGLNQVYVVKFGPDGSEQWFRSAGGAVLQSVADAQVNDDGDLLLCGDVQGTLHFYDTSPDLVANADPYAYYVLRVGADGELQASIAVGSANAVNANALDQRGGALAVLGTFQCQFGELAMHYFATGLFIATGTQDLFIAKHDASTLALNEAQQFGGHQQKIAGGIASLTNGELVFGGSFEELLIFPNDNSAWGESPPCPLATCPGAYCGDPYYGNYSMLESAGQSDGFVARGYVEGRQPYDAFCRSGGGCDRSALDLDVFSFADGVTDEAVVCTGDTLEWSRNIPRPSDPPGICPYWRTISWNVDAAWNDGLLLDTNSVWSTGWYWYTQTSSNGCFSATDSIHETMIPAPLGAVHEEAGGLMLYPILEDMYNVTPCGPDWLVAVDVEPGATVQWTVNGVPVVGDSVHAVQAGEYHLTITGVNGCVSVVPIHFQITTAPPLPNITGVDFDFQYNGVPLSVEDTIPFCGGLCLQGELVSTWYVNGTPQALADSLVVNYNTDYGCGLTLSTGAVPIFWGQLFVTQGWHALHVHIQLISNSCDPDSLVFDAYDSVFVAVLDPPVIAQPDSMFVCAGDTVALVIECTGCTSVEWNGPGIIAISADQDTAWVDQLGSYGVIATNTGLSVSCYAAQSFPVVQAPPPPLYMDPASGIVCPGGSAIISTTSPSTSYEWTGPSGPLGIDNDSVVVSELGSYYLTVHTVGGCALTNGPVAVLQFSSPILQVSPDNVLCPGEQGALEVIGGSVTNVIWSPPLSGGGLVQPIDAPGIYGCVVTSCGSDYTLSATVIGSTVDAAVSGGPFVLCGGGSVLLDGPSGNYTYFWTPDNVFTEDLAVSVPGDHQLYLTDSLGCTDISAVISVTAQAWSDPIMAAGDTLCEGQNTTLTAQGSGTITWYADASLLTVIGTGATIGAGPLFASDTLFVTQTEGDCTSAGLSVVIVVTPQPDAPMIAGDTTLCVGEELLLTVPSQPNVQFVWSTPQGPVNGTQIGLPSVLAANAGVYTCTANAVGCPASADQVIVSVQAAPSTPSITGTTQLCEGDALALEAVGGGSMLSWATPVGVFSGSSIAIANCTLAMNGTWTCTIAGGECPDVSASIAVIVDSCNTTVPVLIIPNVITPNNDGSNEMLTLESPSTSPLALEIFNRWGQVVFSRSAHIVTWDGRLDGSGEVVADGVYYYVVRGAGADGKPIERTGFVQVMGTR